MKPLELLRLSFLNLWRRKLRTTLTVIGVTIGTASIVVMMSIGIGFNKQFMDQIQNSATLTMINIYSYGGGGGGMMYATDSKMGGGGSDASAALTRDVIDGFYNLDHVTAASPRYNFSIFARSGAYESYFNVIAVTHEMLVAMNLPVMEGVIPEAEQPLQFVAGRMTAFNFYNPKSNEYIDYWSNPDAEPPINLTEDSIFGVYDTEAYWQWQSGMGDAPKKYLLNIAALVGDPSSEYGMSEHDYNTYCDIEAVDELFGKIFKKKPWPGQQVDSKGKPIVPMTFTEAVVLVDDVDNVATVQKQITDMGFQAYSQLDTLKMVQEQSRSIQYLLAGIGSISLLVAAIGITNTMMMSIFERTKEIGIFKVLGCSLQNIRAMFLTEAALIGFSGGILGLGMSFGISFVVNKLANNISFIPFWLIGVGIGVAVLVGLVSGILPALRAMKLSPLEAIRSL